MSQGKQILIVEDEKPLAKAMELKLSSLGYQITVAHNGEEALKLMADNSYDLILLDLVMPLMDGFSVLESMNETNNQTPTIVMSNLSQTEDTERALALGAKNFLIKSDNSLTHIVDVINQELK